MSSPMVALTIHLEIVDGEITWQFCEGSSTELGVGAHSVDFAMTGSVTSVPGSHKLGLMVRNCKIAAPQE